MVLLTFLQIPENKLQDTFWLKAQDVALGEEFKTLELNFCAKEDEIKKAMDDGKIMLVLFFSPFVFLLNAIFKISTTYL
jgi:hypothetical protein